MRSEQEMYDLILSVARGDDRIRAVCMNGSRANPNAPCDRFQDFDIVYYVTSVPSFTGDDAWLDVFGRRVIMQKPMTMTIYEEDRLADQTKSFTYLMQFEDGNRIDLMLLPVEKLAAAVHEDSETVLLLDKDGVVGELPPASDVMYHIRYPGQKLFEDVCNEFWWVAPYVAKGLARHEWLYASAHYTGVLRDMLVMMLTWKAGVLTDFSVSAGKCGKYLSRLLPEEDWNALMETFEVSDEETMWKGLERTGILFSKTAHFIAQRTGLSVPQEYEKNVTAYIGRMRSDACGGTL